MIDNNNKEIIKRAEKIVFEYEKKIRNQDKRYLSKKDMYLVCLCLGVSVILLICLMYK